MRTRSALKWLLAFGVLALAAGPAGAQTPTGSPGAQPSGGASADGQVGFQRKTALTPQEQTLEVNKHLSRMEGAAAGVRRMLEEARRQRDVVKTLCLNDKLSQIDVAIRSARDRKTQHQSAVSRNDAELSNHEFTILTVLRQRTEQLVAEANQCIGEESAFVGDTKTSVQIDPQIPPDETPYPPTDPGLVIGPPQCSSCTL
jgi:DNA-binding FrmR family transcriptional regulator